MAVSSSGHRTWRRRALTLVIVLAIAGGLAYRWRAGQAVVPLLGVVHETEIRIAPEVNARFASYRVERDGRVRKGDVLAELSSPELAAALDQAKAAAVAARADLAHVEAGVRREEIDIAGQQVKVAESNLALAREQHRRAATLAASKFGSAQQLDEAMAELARSEANLSLAKANYARSVAGATVEERAISKANVVLADAAVAEAEARLAKTRLTAPADGTVGLLVGEPGEAISKGQPVLTLKVAGEKWFTFTIREDQLEGITIGARLPLVTARGERFEARVTELRPLGEFAVWRAARAVGDHDLNSFLVRADPATDVSVVEPGMTVWIVR